MQRLLIFMLCVGLCHFAVAQLPKDSRRPGGIAVIALAPHIKNVSYQQKAVLMTQYQQQRYAIFGIPLTTPIGPLVLNTNAEPISIHIHSYQYPEQRLKVKNQQHVHPSQEQLKRYAREAQIQAQVYQSFSPSVSTQWPSFILPTQGRLTNSFGRKRFFNGEARAPHSGLDIPAPVGQKVVAPAAGTVAAIGDYFFNGKTVMIDHGQGLISMFCHLSAITVKQGQAIKQGEILGLVGKTGRVTGAHLHWSMSLNNARVDPQLFLTSSLGTQPNSSKR